VLDDEGSAEPGPVIPKPAPQRDAEIQHDRRTKIKTSRLPALISQAAVNRGDYKILTW